MTYDEIGRAGIAYCPEERGIFASLTVEENLFVGLKDRPRSAIEEAYALFPRLAERRRNLGSQLSGGEQQMLAIGRALMSRPRLLLLDEVLAGLNPSEVRDMLPVIRAIANRGVTIVMIEHIMQAVMSLAEQVFVLSEGRIIAQGTPKDIAADPHVIEAYLGHGAAARIAAGAVHA